eukprot:TRINITY_DN9528_c0_g1_i1.p2 TRINITY_DN9528_c0_g1~~TRINITY_DN9528_c0_g1_i1.p2  ORF type:complete len:111 (+),score=17.09 TRINITY_DN9528_c0_g1_i1:112-444(+)
MLVDSNVCSFARALPKYTNRCWYGGIPSASWILHLMSLIVAWMDKGPTRIVLPVSVRTLRDICFVDIGVGIGVGEEPHFSGDPVNTGTELSIVICVRLRLTNEGTSSLEV